MTIYLQKITRVYERTSFYEFSQKVHFFAKTCKKTRLKSPFRLRYMIQETKTFGLVSTIRDVFPAAAATFYCSHYCINLDFFSTRIIS